MRCEHSNVHPRHRYIDTYKHVYVHLLGVALHCRAHVLRRRASTLARARRFSGSHHIRRMPCNSQAPLFRLLKILRTMSPRKEIYLRAVSCLLFLHTCRSAQGNKESKKGKRARTEGGTFSFDVLSRLLSFFFFLDRLSSANSLIGRHAAQERAIN